MLMTMSYLLAAGMAMAATPVTAQGQRPEAEVAPTSQIDSTTAADEVPIGRDDGDRMTVAVSVSGKGPYRFLVDTGSERTVWGMGDGSTLPHCRRVGTPAGPRRRRERPGLSRAEAEAVLAQNAS